MQRVDLLILGVLAVSLVASGVGVLAYEDTRNVQPFDVTWVLRDTPLGDESVQMGGAGDQAFTLAVTQPNVTSVRVELRVDGGAPRVQDVAGRAEVTPPNGTAVSQEFTLPASPTGAGVDVAIDVPLATVANATGIEARSPEEAIALALPANATSAAMGEWTIHVALSSTAPGPLAGTYTVSYTAIGRQLNGSAVPQIPDVGR